jgi:hypothetical protein
MTILKSTKQTTMTKRAMAVTAKARKGTGRLGPENGKGLEELCRRTRRVDVRRAFMEGERGCQCANAAKEREKGKAVVRLLY